jgi:hypothetical protein
VKRHFSDAEIRTWAQTAALRTVTADKIKRAKRNRSKRVTVSLPFLQAVSRELHKEGNAP